MSVDLNEKQVQNTNNSSITSKLSASSKGYFTDDFLQYFVDKPRHRSSIINRGYHVRALKMEQSIQTILSILNRYPCSQIVNLGAGFDTTYFRLQSLKLLQSIQYFEVDFDPVINRKKEIILTTPVLKNLIDIVDSYNLHNKHVALKNKNYTMISSDLCNLKSLEKSFKEGGIDTDLPTVFISECVLNYLDAKSSDNLIKWIADKFSNSVFIVYDQINPLDGFGSVMINHFASIGTPLGSILKYPTSGDQEKRYKNLGWQYCVCKDVSDSYSSLPESEIDRLNSLEIFDEYEELDLVCSHYCLIVSAQGNVSESLWVSDNCSEKKDCQESNIKIDILPSSLERFGHSTALLTDNKVVVSGGFGPNSKGHHERLKGLTSFYLKTDFEMTNEPVTDDLNILGSRMFGGMVNLSDEKILLFGGRDSPSSDSYKCPVLITKKSAIWKAEILKCTLSNSEYFPIWRHTSSYIKQLDKLVIYGGVNGKMNVSSKMIILDLETSCWEKKSERNPGRHSHSAAVYGNKILISGGRNKCRSLSLLESYDILTDKWKTISTIPEIKPRYSHTSHIFGGDHLLLLGGVVNSDAFVSLVNLKSMSCLNIALPFNIVVPQIFIRHSSYILEDTDNVIKIMCVGGGGNCFSFGSHFNKNCIVTVIKSYIKN